VPVEVALTYSEILLAGNAGVMRQVSALRNRRVSLDAHYHDALEGHVSGAVAEWAVSKWLGVRWDPTIGIGWAGEVEGDALNVEVRSTIIENGCLIAHDYSFDDRPYLLVLAHRAPVFVLAGWLPGSECKDRRFWRANAPRPAYFVPQRELRPVEELRGALVAA
jgi:hypothetical protein